MFWLGCRPLKLLENGTTEGHAGLINVGCLELNGKLMEWGPLGSWLAYLSPSGSSCILSRLQPSKISLATGPGVSGHKSKADPAQVSFNLIKV